MVGFGLLGSMALGGRYGSTRRFGGKCRAGFFPAIFRDPSPPAGKNPALRLLRFEAAGRRPSPQRLRRALSQPWRWWVGVSVGPGEGSRSMAFAAGFGVVGSMAQTGRYTPIFADPLLSQSLQLHPQRSRLLWERRGRPAKNTFPPTGRGW